MTLGALVGKRILRNLTALYAGELLRFLFGIAIAATLGRALGTSAFGTYSFVLALALFLAIPLDFGFSSYSLWKCARNRRLLPRYLSTTLALQLLGGVPLLALLIFTSFHTATFAFVLPLSMLWMLTQALSETLFTVFRVYERMHWEAIIKVIERAVFLVGVLIALHKGWALSGIFAMLAVAGSLSFLLTIVLVRRYYYPTLCWQSPFLRIFLRQSWPFGLSVVFAALYFHIDTIMLYLLSDSATTGTYSAAARVLFMSFLIPGVVSNASFPALTRMLAKARAQAQQLYHELVQYSAFLGAILAMLAFRYADDILALLYGTPFRTGAPVLRVLSFVIFTKLIATRAGDVLTASGAQGRRTAIQGYSAVINISFNLFLIPLAGGVGAAIATLIAELYLLFGYFRNASTFLPYTIDCAWVIRLLCSIAAGFGLSLVPLPGHWLLQAVLVTIGTIAIAFPLRVLSIPKLRAFIR